MHAINSAELKPKSRRVLDEIGGILAARDDDTRPHGLADLAALLLAKATSEDLLPAGSQVEDLGAQPPARRDGLGIGPLGIRRLHEARPLAASAEIRRFRLDNATLGMP